MIENVISINLNAHPLLLLLLLVFFITAFTWVYVFARFRQSSLGRIYLIYVLLLLSWQLSTLMLDSASSVAAVIDLMRLGSIGWLSLGACFLAFVYCLIDRKFDGFLYGACATVFIAIWVSVATDYTIDGAAYIAKGWHRTTGVLYMPSVLLAIVLPILFALKLLWQAGQAPAMTGRRKKQLNLLFYGSALSFVLGLLFDVVLPEFFANNYFVLGAASVGTIQAMAIFLGIVRYHFLGVDVMDVAYDLFEQVHDAVMIINEEGKVLNRNRATMQMFSADIGVGTNITSLLGDDYHLFQIGEQKLSINKGGEQLYLRLEQAPLAGGKDVGQIVICSDVSEHARSERKYRSLFESTIDAIIVLNQEGFMDCNRATLSLFGCEKHEAFVGQQMTTFSPVLQPGGGASKALENEHIQQAFQLGSNRFEWQFCRRDGSSFPSEVWMSLMEMDGVKVLQATVRDLTYQKSIMAEVEDHANFTVESPFPILRLDRTGKLLFANPAAEDLLVEWGVTKGSILPEAWHRVAMDVFEKGSQSVAVPSKEKVYLATFAAVEHKDYLNVYCADVTDSKQAEEELRYLNEMLEHKVWEKTLELETFNHAVSHEMMSPLHIVEGYAQALEEDFSDKLGDVGAHYIKRIHVGVQRLKDEIEDALKLSRLDHIEPEIETVDLSAMCHKFMKKFREKYEGSQVNFEVESGCMAQGDRELLQVVMEHLLHNAWKFSSLETKSVVSFGREETSLGPAWFVRDNGVGFDMSQSADLFVPYKRLASASGFTGDGVGLPVVKRILNRCGGMVWAESELGKGATFYFQLSATLKAQERLNYDQEV